LLNIQFDFCEALDILLILNLRMAGILDGNVGKIDLDSQVKIN
jgi:hypothetical protein